MLSHPPIPFRGSKDPIPVKGLDQSVIPILSRGLGYLKEQGPPSLRVLAPESNWETIPAVSSQH